MNISCQDWASVQSKCVLHCVKYFSFFTQLILYKKDLFLEWFTITIQIHVTIIVLSVCVGLELNENLKYCLDVKITKNKHLISMYSFILSSQLSPLHWDYFFWQTGTMSFIVATLYKTQPPGYPSLFFCNLTSFCEALHV